MSCAAKEATKVRGVAHPSMTYANLGTTTILTRVTSRPRPRATCVQEHHEHRTPHGRATTSGTSDGGKNLILAAMIFAVGMTFIDQTIVAIAIPEIQKDLGLSPTGLQWVVNAYLLSLAALFAFGGRLSDIVGHKKMVVARRGRSSPSRRS